MAQKLTLALEKRKERNRDGKNKVGIARTCKYKINIKSISKKEVNLL